MVAVSGLNLDLDLHLRSGSALPQDLYYKDFVVFEKVTEDSLRIHVVRWVGGWVGAGRTQMWRVGSGRGWEGVMR